jgi:hypothetical protein
MELAKVARTLTRLVAQRITSVSSPLPVTNVKRLTAQLKPYMMTVALSLSVMLILIAKELHAKLLRTTPPLLATKLCLCA